MPRNGAGGTFRRIVAAIPLAWALAACAAGGPREEQPQPTGLVIEGMRIRNELAYPVTDVMIEVPATGAFAGCGHVLPRSECSTRFETIDYLAHAMVVNWKEYGAPQKTDEFVVKVPEGLDRGRPAWLEVVIFGRGQAGAKLTQ